MVRVLFVCTGNICRSPTAEGLFRALVRDEGLDHVIETDSAGTHGYHVGDRPDPRSLEAARRRNVDISDQRARKVRPADFEDFDLILAMDRGHMRLLHRMAPPGRAERVRLFLEFAPELGLEDVPDPYYGGSDGFETVLDLIEVAAARLLAHIRKSHL